MHVFLVDFDRKKVENARGPIFWVEEVKILDPKTPDVVGGESVGLWALNLGKGVVEHLDEAGFLQNFENVSSVPFVIF